MSLIWICRVALFNRYSTGIFERQCGTGKNMIENMTREPVREEKIYKGKWGWGHEYYTSGEWILEGRVDGAWKNSSCSYFKYLNQSNLIYIWLNSKQKLSWHFVLCQTLNINWLEISLPSTLIWLSPKSPYPYVPLVSQQPPNLLNPPAVRPTDTLGCGTLLCFT